MSHNPTNSTSLAADEISVWVIPLGETLEPDTLVDSLSADERRRADLFSRDDLHRRFVVAHSAMRRILGGYLDAKPADLPIEYGPHGKPRLGHQAGQASLRFNLSHSGELAVLAVTRGGEIGIDVERLRAVRQREQLAKRYFAASEVAAVLAAAAPRRDAEFLAVWTAKEAILKAIGTGLSYPLDRFAVSPSAATQWVSLPNQDEVRAANDDGMPGRHASIVISKWWLERVDVVDGYLAAVASDAQKKLRPLAYFPDDLG